jgi:hypothetical protein
MNLATPVVRDLYNHPVGNGHARIRKQPAIRVDKPICGNRIFSNGDHF